MRPRVYGRTLRGGGGGGGGEILRFNYFIKTFVVFFVAENSFFLYFSANLVLFHVHNYKFYTNRIRHYNLSLMLQKFTDVDTA